VALLAINFNEAAKVALTINSTICSKPSGKVKNLMFRAGFAEMLVSMSKCSRLFLSFDMRASAGVVLVQSSDNLSAHKCHSILKEL